MAASFIASTLPNNYNHAFNANHHQFGAADDSIHNTTGNDWDEQVVPALRKRLEEESLQLDKRFSRLGMQRQESQNSRLTPRLDRNNEIIQDGLGSDDLIPSEWVTGSKAQFAAISYGSRSRNDESQHSNSGTHHITALDYSSPSHYNSATLGPPSPTSLSASSRNSHHYEAQSPTTTQTIAKAREKARKLAKERELAVLEQQISGHDWPEEAESNEETHGRLRTLSTPNTLKSYALNAQGAQASSNSNHTQETATARSSSGSKGSKRDDNAEPSKIPLPTSGSMSKFQGMQRADSKDVYRSKSSGVLSSFANSPHQDYAQDIKGSSPNKSSSPRKAQVERRSPRRVMNSPPTQDILDEFGPLGGTPKVKRGPRRTMDDGGQRSHVENNTTRSVSNPWDEVSNPWDEEMLPVVKRRLEQQRMLEEMSQDDSFIDTWDRNGLPLSKSQLMLKKKAREDRSLSGQQSEQGKPIDDSDQRTKSNDDSDQHTKPNDDSAQRMKRLQEALDFGVAGNGDREHQQQQQQHMYDNQQEKVDMLEKQSRVVQHNTSQVDGGPAAPNPALSPEKKRKVDAAPIGKQNTKAPSKSEDVPTCCCIIA